jgi:hypothetical protein
MAQEIINIGTTPNDGTGDPLRIAMTKVNNNFSRIFTEGPVGSNIIIANNTITTNVSSGNVVIRGLDNGQVQIDSTLVGQNGQDLGTTVVPWNNLYVNAVTGNVVNVAGNITTPRAVVANLIVANIGSYTTLSATGNATVGNITATAIVGTLATAAQPNVTALGTLGNLSVSGNATVGNVNAGAVIASGNISGSYILGNGSQLSGMYGDANVATYLPTYRGNITLGSTNTISAGNVSVQSTITTFGNINSVAGWFNSRNAVIGNINSTGNISVSRDLTVSGNLTVTGTTLSLGGTDQKLVILANNTSNSTVADGSGIKVGNPTIGSFLFNDATTSWQSNISITPASNNFVNLGTSSYRWATAYAGNVYAGNVSGTITTSNQPNITGLGTLTSLLVSNTLSAGGNISANNFISSDIYVSNVWATSANIVGNISGANLIVNGLLLTAQSTKTANAVGVAGQVAWDSNYIYVCVATNTWKRTALVGGY